MQHPAASQSSAPSCAHPAACRSPEALLAKLQPLAKELDADLATTADLLAAVPTLFSINQPAMVKDRLEALAGPLGVR